MRISDWSSDVCSSDLVEFDAVAAADAHAGLRDLAVDLDQAVGDALLQRAARAQAGLGQDLVQALFQPRGAGGAFCAALQGKLAAVVRGITHCMLRVLSPSAARASVFVSSDRKSTRLNSSN